MKRLILFYILILSGCLTSCVTSFYPLCDPHSAITNPDVEGKWQSTEGNVNIQLLSKSRKYKEWTYNTIKVNPKQTYVVNIARGTDTTVLLGRMIRLENNVFMDLTPIQRSAEHFETYVIGKVVEINNNKFSIAFANSAFIDQQMKAGRLRIAHASDTLFGSNIVTASTEELQRFVTKYANDERLFKTDDPFTLKR